MEGLNRGGGDEKERRDEDRERERREERIEQGCGSESSLNFLLGSRVQVPNYF